MKAFKAIVTDTHEEVIRMDVTTGKDDRQRIDACRSGRFTLQSDGECPWPPHTICGRRVVVMSVEEYRRLTQPVATPASE